MLAKVLERLVSLYQEQPGFQSFVFVDGGETMAPDLALRETVLGEITTPG